MDEIEEINNKIKELRKARIEIRKKLKKVENHNITKYNNPNNNVNLLIRVSTEFDRELTNIQEIREENGLLPLSKPEITRLILKHKHWKNGLKKDIIDYNPEIEVENVA